MYYYDDILNVYAYLQSKTKENLLTAKAVIEEQRELDRTIDGLNRQADELLAQVSGLAAEMEVDISDIVSGNEDGFHEVSKKECEECPQLRIHLPADFDFQADFRRLCDEAHKAGFINVHPEELLSPEEMRRADAVDRELDLKFADATGLRKKDLAVLSIAAVIQSFCFFMGRKMDGGQTAEESCFMEGIDGCGLRSYQQILQEHTPFDVADNHLIRRKDIAGFDECLGWIVGVLNILTNTVTTYKLKSYSVIQSASCSEKPQIGEEVSTLFGVVIPVLKNVAAEKKSVIAAVIQEAAALKYGNANLGEINRLFCRAVELEEKNHMILENAGPVLSRMGGEWAGNFDGMETVSFLNTMIAAIHAVLYEEGDGNIDMYAVRTNKIIAYSGAMSAVINSLPAVVAQDIAAADYTGIMAACLNLFHSARFWIEAKANFLASEYKRQIDKEMERIDRYFVYE